MHENMKKEYYSSDLKKGILDSEHMDELKELLGNHLTIEKIPNDLIKTSNISGYLTKLPLFIAKGNKSWQGLVVGFPGDAKDITTRNVGTPFLRMLLYPILELFQRVNEHLNNDAKCVYFLGSRFPDVFVRKFKLLSLLTPHLIILTNDLVKTIRDYSPEISKPQNNKLESLYQQKLCAAMNSEGGLSVPTASGQIKIGYISHKVRTAEGTKNPEELDILGYDTKNNSLVVFEIKGPSCKKNQLENLFLQGLDHRNWIEDNKMAIKFIKEGPQGKKINTRKRTRLILGFCNEEIPPLFHELRNTLVRKDKYVEIDFVNIRLNNDKIELSKA